MKYKKLNWAFQRGGEGMDTFWNFDKELFSNIGFQNSRNI